MHAATNTKALFSRPALEVVQSPQSSGQPLESRAWLLVQAVQELEVELGCFSTGEVDDFTEHLVEVSCEDNSIVSEASCA